MTTRAQQTKAAIAALGATPDVDLARRTLAEWDVRDQAAALISTATTGGGSFTPTDLDDLALWLDASTLELADNAAVTTWPDSSGQGNDATQATADNKPVFKTAIQNGLGIVRFDPAVTNRFMGLPLDLFRNLDGATIGVVASVPDFTASGSIIWASQNDDSYARIDIAPAVSFTNPADGGANAGASSQFKFPAANSFFAWVCTCAWTPQGAMLIEPAALLDTGSPADGLVTIVGTSDTDSGSVQIGSSSGGHELTGDIGELLVYQRTLNIGERRQLLDYLAAKWATL